MRTVMYSFVVATASQWRPPVACSLGSFKEKFLRQTDKRANYGKGFHPNKNNFSKTRTLNQPTHSRNNSTIEDFI